MEYSSDANAQAAYVTNANDIINQSQVTRDNDTVLGDASGNEHRRSQGFKLSGANTFVTAVTIRQGPTVNGSPTGNWTIRIETDNGGVPSGTLANANASVVVSPPGINTNIKCVFSTVFSLTAGTLYHIVILCDNQSNDTSWALDFKNSNVYSDGNASVSTNGGSSWTEQTWDLYFIVHVQSLQSYSESTIKTQGSYALKAVAAQTDSLNKTLTHTFASPLDLSGVNTAKIDMRASRTGANVKLGLHDTGGTTTELTPTIATGDTYQTVTWDLSAVADADKNAIDKFIITPTNADSANTVYFDNFVYMKK
jgi:hypothetical protein